MTTGARKLLVHSGTYGPAVLRCGWMNHPGSGTERQQGRKSYRFYLISDGILTLEEGGRSDDFRAGDMLIMPPGGDRALRFSQRAAIVHLIFDVTAAPRYRTERGWEHVAGVGSQPSPRAVWGIDLPRRVPAPLAASGRDMVHLARAWYWRGPTGYARACGRLTAWLGDLVYALATPAEPDARLLPETGPQALAQALELLDDPHLMPLPVHLAAEGAGVSREHLARLARRHLDRPLRTIRAERQSAMAARLLQETARPIAAIAQQLGYKHPQSFQRAFRRWFGVTPARFRAQVR